MLPAQRQVVNGVAIDAHCIACSELGGDIFDYAPAGNGAAAAVLVADVAGHGVSAAMLTTIVKASFWSSVSDDFDPVAVVERGRGDQGVQRPAVRDDRVRGSTAWSNNFTTSALAIRRRSCGKAVSARSSC